MFASEAYLCKLVKPYLPSKKVALNWGWISNSN